MKKQLVYTESDINTFHDFIAFLDNLSNELNQEYELTQGRAELLNKTKNMIIAIMEAFPSRRQLKRME